MYSVIIRKHVMLAHSLPHPGFGVAQNLHGATYVIDAEFKSETLNEMQVVVDIDKALQWLEQTLAPLNYQNLDNLPQFKGTLTTTEFLAKYIHSRISLLCKNEFTGSLKITLNESHIAAAAYEGTV